jgi:hypothetical protein
LSALVTLWMTTVHNTSPRLRLGIFIGSLA